MDYVIKPTQELHVSDLVIDPFEYAEALAPVVRRSLLASEAADHLAQLLPLAIAQLDAVGDVYGALALAGLYAQMEPLHALV